MAVNAEWPGVSVVMPVLNEERHLPAAVGRVLAQEYPGALEVILAIGPSRDRTHQIAEELAAADPRVRVVDNPAARTPAALNLGVAAASHEIIVRAEGRTPPRAGTTIWVAPDLDHVHLFDTATGNRLPD